MKKLILAISFVLISFLTTAQELSIDKPVYNREGIRLELVDYDEYTTTVKYQSIGVDGKLLQEGTYLNGKPDGVWIMYNGDGTVSKMKFKNGKRIALETVIEGRKTKVFYVNNKPVKTVAYFD